MILGRRGWGRRDFFFYFVCLEEEEGERCGVSRRRGWRDWVVECSGGGGRNGRWGKILNGMGLGLRVGGDDDVAGWYWWMVG